MSGAPAPFSDPAVVAGYPESAPRRVPGYADLHRMAALLLSEAAPADGEILVLGAGGGLELKAFADLRPEWRLTGVDPSGPMLDVARRVLGPRRATLIEGRIEDAPAGPFDGATCLLTLHFLDRPERLRTLRQLRARLSPEARLAVAHHVAPGGEARLWLGRSVAFADDGERPEHLARSADALASGLPLLSEAEEEALLREAGFRDVALFYAALSFRGWTATA